MVSILLLYVTAIVVEVVNGSPSVLPIINIVLMFGRYGNVCPLHGEKDSRGNMSLIVGHMPGFVIDGNL